MDSENKKWVHICVAVVCVTTAYILQRGLVFVSNYAGIADSRILDIFPLSGLVAAALAVGLFAFLVLNKTVMGFLTEVVGEFKKVVWPTRKETTMSTVVVVALVLITAVILWAFDWMWSSLIRTLIS